MGIDASAGEQATGGSADLESLVVVEVDPPNWLAGLEEESRGTIASETGVVPCAMCVSGGGSRRALLGDSRNPSFRGDAHRQTQESS
jgi:hypothetical protein